MQKLMVIAAGRSVSDFMEVKPKNFGDRTPISFHGVSELSKSLIVNLLFGTLSLSCQCSIFCHDILLHMIEMNMKKEFISFGRISKDEN